MSIRATALSEFEHCPLRPPQLVDDESFDGCAYSPLADTFGLRLRAASISANARQSRQV
jgi:hypothetical protein